MATVKRPLGERLQHDDARVCYELRKHGLTITVDQYKIARFIFQAVAIGTIVLTAIFPEVELSSTAYLVLGALALGPNVVEAYLTRES